jgi:hypothetical protein
MHRSSPGVADTGKTGIRPVGNGLKMARFGGRIGGPGVIFDRHQVPVCAIVAFGDVKKTVPLSLFRQRERFSGRS